MKPSSRAAPLAAALVVLALLASPARQVFAFSDGQSASLVIGQTSFTSSASATSRTGLDEPTGAAFDPSGNLWVTDYLNSRVLEFAKPFTTGEAASLVIGQPDFTSGGNSTTATTLDGPRGLAFDPSGDLWVADYLNNRVLEYVPPFSDGQAASLVIGQPDLTSDANATTAAGLYGPLAIAFDSAGNLWLVDKLNNRVLEYAKPFSTDEPASLVIGQPNFTASTSATTSSSFDRPRGLAFDPSGDLWVTDYLNDRVLEFEAPLRTGEAASLVIGQPGFTSSAPADTATGLDEPVRVAFDSSGDLWVTDYLNNRILEYSPPFSTGEAASLVIGQPNFTTNSSATTRNGLDGPDRVAFDSQGDLWIPDVVNNRVLEYSSLPSSSPVDASLAVPILVATAAVLVYELARRRTKRSKAAQRPHVSRNVKV